MINRLDELLINVMASDKKLFKYLSLISPQHINTRSLAPQSTLCTFGHFAGNQ